MEYSIQELSKLSGVTTRTLRWYDQIGLLKPSRVAESGYRYYGKREVDRLQDILYYRALGVELARIRECLDNPSFDRLAALKGHLTALEAEKQKLEGLIHSLKITIRAEERNEIMNDQEKFEAFKKHAVEEHEKYYGKESREKYGDAQVDKMQDTVMNLTKEQYQEWTELEQRIQGLLETAVTSQADPKEEIGKEITTLHKRWLTLTGNSYDVRKHKGIVELYVADERFTEYYDRSISGCAQFLRDAVVCWAE